MRRTKIVCTIGPASSTVAQLDRLAAAGMDVARLNFSHGTHAEHAEVIQRIREAEARWNRPVAILQDLQGPKIRLGTFGEGGGRRVDLEAGRPFTLCRTHCVGTSERVFVSTPAWAAILRRIAPDAPEAEWLPVPSTIPRVGDRNDAHGIVRRYGGSGARLVGHFGSYGPPIVRHLDVAIPALLERTPDASILLLGEGGVALRQRLVDAGPALSRRIWATGPLAAREASLHLLACDLMLQPFVEGVTTRRTSVMAALLHGVPTVTTSGRLTEPLWRQTGAVALAPAADPTALAAVASALLADPTARARLGVAGEAAYDRLFDVRHTIAALRRTDRQALHLAGAHVH